ncbi:uncharacterized protein LOC104878482 [Vitis vinifera]|uniref:uncharacterized protein LOC104878482 n=1 Tax=Vitis vinifera TaxID=29760 RepID=UPI0028831769|nr:uncharacterized protein LOC104878482 [Vitis vinifera]
MSKKANKGSKLSRCMKAPFKILACVRDLYIRSMTEFAGRVSYGSAMGCPTAQVSSLPKSFSVSSSKSSGDQDLSELIKVASARSLSNKIELDLLRRQPSSKSPVTGTNVVPRSMSVGIGRIDEDKPCEFGEDIKVNTDAFPRSRSYAVSKKTGIF